jgi:ATP-binding cassette, subfamily C, bacterial CydD
MSSNPENASKWLGKLTADAKLPYLYASLITILSASCFVGFSWYLSNFAATWLNTGQVIPINLLYATVFMAGRYVFAHVASLLNYSAGNAIVSKLKMKLYPKLLQNNQTDSIASTLLVTRAADDMKPFFSFFIPYAMASVIVSFVLLIVCFWLEKWVGYILLFSFLVIPLQMAIIGIGAEALHKKHINLFLKYSAVFYNRLHTVAEIVNLDNLKPQYTFLADKSKELNTATTNVMRVAILSSAVLELFVTIAIAAIAIYTGMSLLGIMPGPNYGKGYSFQLALFLLMLAPYYFFYLRKFVSAYHDRNKAVASAKLLMPLFNEPETEPFNDVNQTHETILIQGLSFAYPNTVVKVLHNIELSLPQKGLVLIKGISGSGKSTLLKILSGNLTVDQGTLTVNNQTTQWSQQWLSANTSYMNQYPFVFDGSLRYNVFLNNDDQKSAHPEFLNRILNKKPDGWQTQLTHNGKQLSGGEKQLLTLARMMLYPKPIAILDEPTANLDPDTVNLILEQILQMARHQLVIVASHEDKFDAVATTTLQLNWGEQMA